jgi:hypothetical protein
MDSSSRIMSRTSLEGILKAKDDTKNPKDDPGIYCEDECGADL